MQTEASLPSLISGEMNLRKIQTDEIYLVIFKKNAFSKCQLEVFAPVFFQVMYFTIACAIILYRWIQHTWLCYLREPFVAEYFNKYDNNVVCCSHSSQVLLSQVGISEFV